MIESARPASLLSVTNLSLERADRNAGVWRPLLRSVDLDLAPGERVALVGPSGCGKSLTARALLGLLPPGLRWAGEVSWRGRPLLDPRGEAWRRIRGTGMGLVLQDPLASLNPVLTAGAQIAETLRLKQGLARDMAWDRTRALLAETQVPDPDRVARSYPHQLSGGLRQRVLLAATLAGDPDLLIADEPTTALDAAVQKNILQLLRGVCRQRQMALLLISHDRDLVSLLTDRVVFMADGRTTHTTRVADLPLSAPPVVAAAAPPSASAVLVARGVVISYAGQRVPAVAGVDLDLRPGQATGLVGESGCGKTSLARALSGHLQAGAGDINLEGVPFPAASGGEFRRQRRQVQLLFQDPGGSLDPRQTVAGALREAGGVAGPSPAALLAEVGLPAELGRRYPHQLSGGQRQRVALARCLAPAPAVLIADEPTSALDDEAREQILRLLGRIRDTRGLALLVISHDLDVVQAMCAEIHVMLGGRVVESLPGSGTAPRHPYTHSLRAAMPRTLREHPRVWAEAPDNGRVFTRGRGAGCAYFGDCPLQKVICGKELPDLVQVADGHWLRCPEAETHGPSHFIDTI